MAQYCILLNLAKKATGKENVAVIPFADKNLILQSVH